jgi:hypothetical protein
MFTYDEGYDEGFGNGYEGGKKDERDEWIEKIKRLDAELYDALPTGDIDAFQLLKVIDEHKKKLEALIE